jgi:hypothetical protein
MLRAIGWFVATGNVFLNADWDEKGGRMLPRTVLVEAPHPENPDATIDADCPCDESGEPYRREPEDETDVAPDGGKPFDFDKEPDLEPEGEITFDVDDPFSVRYNPDAQTPMDANEWYVGRLMSLTEIAAEFDIDESELEDLGDDEGTDMREEAEDLLSRIAAAAPDPFSMPQIGILGGDQSKGSGDRRLVIWYYRQPDAAAGWPHGRHFIVAGRKKIWPKEDDTDFPHGEAPLPHGFWPPRVPAIDTPIPGQPHGMGALQHVVPLNEQLNYLDGKIAEYHVTMAMGGVWFVGPGDKNITITSEPGQVKVSKEMGAKGRAGAPVQAQLQALPEAIYRERDVILMKIKLVSGVSDVDLSQRPEGVSAGRAFLVLQEASDSAIMPSLLSLEHAMEEIGRRELVIAREKYSEERTILIRGEKGKWEYRSFTKADLRDGMTVRVQAGSSFPWSKSAQWDTKLSLIQALPQLIMDETGMKIDSQKLGRYLEAGAAGLSAFESQEDPDSVEVTREHAMFESYDPMNPDTTNEKPELGFWQNHAIHLKLHCEFMKRDRSRFDRWSQPAQQAFLEHIKLTTMAMQQLVDQAMPAQPAPGAADPSADPANADPAPDDPTAGAPTGAPAGAAPAPVAGGRRLQLQKPGGQSARLTPGDFASAGQ